MRNIAIYSRKSIFTGKGESIENQIQLCENYCKTYMDEKDLAFTIYEDEGFSGKNTNRPKFKELINDIKSKKVDVLICYRLDRISRNVSDFSSTLELLQKYNVTFISLKEQFDTSTPMGRAMIYIASVFAQLERETIAERVKDNMLQLAKMGKWSGGQLPIGFSSERFTYTNEEMKEKSFVKLVPINEELEIVKFIYDNYLLKGSILNVVRELNEKGLKSKNGADFELSVVKRILKNTLYVKSDNMVHEYLKNTGLNVYGEPNGNGYLTYNKSNKNKNEWIVAVSAHKGIIDSEKWLQVQRAFDKNKSSYTSNRSGTGSNDTLFSGLLKCKKCGSPMVIKYNTKNKQGKNYIYYTCSSKVKNNKKKCDCPSLRADIIDSKLLDNIKFYNKDTLIDVYNKKIKDLTKSSNKDILKSVEDDVKKKENQAHNLIMQLSNTTNKDISKMIMKEIDNINNEIVSLKEKISSIENADKYIKNTITNINDLIYYFKNFNKYIDSMDDINAKRLLLRSIVKEIIFDSENKNFDIKFFCLDDMQLEGLRESMDCNLYSGKG